jgi:protein-S-isoprenylcysteine O-methyltransferase Ste14
VSLIPAFEIGVWNAWIFMLAWLLFNAADPNWLVRRRDFKALFKKSSAIPHYNTMEKTINILSLLILILFFIYSIFLPLPLGTVWFYAGLAIFLSGLTIWEIAGIPWTATRIDEPITTGLYRYSRHPMYIAIFLQLMGAGIASASWLFLLMALGYTVLQLFLLITAEERFCLEKYGDTYREYTNRTPRWLGIPKG